MTPLNLPAFAREVMNTFWADRMLPDEPDGGTLQDIAEKHGVLLPHSVTERCGDNCACADYAEFPTTCYRMNPELQSADGAELQGMQDAIEARAKQIRASLNYSTPMSNYKTRKPQQ